MPTVSVIINTYNSSRFLLRAIDSVLAQTYRDFELIVVDDGSTDDTREAVAPYRDRLTYIHQENKKYSAAKNTGIRASSGDYIAFMDSDDLWLPDKLERQVAVLEQHPEAVLTYCQAIYIDPDDRQIQFRGKIYCNPEGDQLVIADMRKELFMTTVVAPGSTMLVRRWAVERAGLFDEAHVHGEDWELWLRIAPFGLFAYSPEVLSKYRVYGWQKIITVEARESWLQDLEKIVKTAAELWPGEPAEAERLRNLSLKRINTHAALASYQVGDLEQGKAKLENLLAKFPQAANREDLAHMVLDRAKEIADDSGDMQAAEDFIGSVFAHLPESARRYTSAGREAIAWLYLNKAFEYSRGEHWDVAAGNLRKGISAWPLALLNRGVASILVKALIHSLRGQS